MSEDQQNDRDFFSRLNGYGETPPPQVREELQARLKEKKKHRIGAFWWMGTGSTTGFRIAAALTGALLVFYFLQKQNAPDTPLSVQTTDSVLTAPPSAEQSTGTGEVASTAAQPLADAASDQVQSSGSTSGIPAKDDVKRSVRKAPVLREKKHTAPDKKEDEDLQPVPVSPQLVFGSTGEGEENPFLPEGNSVAVQQQECEDEAQQGISTLSDEIKDSAVAAVHLISDSMKVSRSLQRGWSWSLALTGGINQWDNRYSDGASPVASNSLEQAERQVVSFMGGAEVRASVGKWMITSGLKYARQLEDWAFKTIRNDFGESGAAFMYNDTTYGSLILLDGYEAAWSDPATPGTSSSFSALTVTDTMIRNDYSRFSIPLLIGYRIKAGEKVSLGVHTGVAYSNLFDADVWLYNINDRTVRRTDEKDAVWRRNSVDALFCIEAAYAVTDRFSLLLRPAGSLMLTSQFNKDYAARRRSFRQSVEGGVVLRW